MNQLLKPACLALGLIALAAFPFVAAQVDASFYVTVVARILIFAIAATALNLVFGYGGLVSLGHALFLGLGAYSVAIPGVFGISNGFAHLGICIAVCALAGAITGAISLRTTGIGFIMITLAFAQMLFYLAVSLRKYGGDDGYTLYAPLHLIGGENAITASGAPLYWVVLVIVALVLLALWRVEASHFGRALEGIRDNETRMQAMGYPTYLLKLCAFAAAGGVASLSGALIATQNGFISPSLMHWTQSALFIVMVVIGGVGRRWGAPLGVAVWLVFEEVLKQFTEYWHAPMGLLLIAVVFLAPKGLSALASRKAAP